MKKATFTLEIEFNGDVTPAQMAEIAQKAVCGIGFQACNSSEGVAPDAAETYVELIAVTHESGQKSVGTISGQGNEVLTTDIDGNETTQDCF